MRCLDAVAAERAALGRPTRRCWCSTTPPTTAPRTPSGRAASDLELIALERARRQGVGRQRADAARARPLLPAAQRGLRAAARAPRRRSPPHSRPTRRRRARSPRCAARTARRSRLRVALPERRRRAGGRADARPAVRRAEPRHARPGGSTGASRPRCSCAARPRRRSTGWTPRSSSTPTRSTSRSASRCAGWHSLYVPSARAIHHEQLSTGALPAQRIVELARGRDRYMRKHHGVARRRRRPLADRVDVPRCARSRRPSLPGHDPRPLPRPCRRRAAPARAARGWRRRPRATTPRAPRVR